MRQLLARRLLQAFTRAAKSQEYVTHSVYERRANGYFLDPLGDEDEEVLTEKDFFRHAAIGAIDAIQFQVLATMLLHRLRYTGDMIEVPRYRRAEPREQCSSAVS